MFDLHRRHAPSLSKYKGHPSYLQLSSCLVTKHIHPENSRTTLLRPCKISARMALGLLYPYFMKMMKLRYATIRMVARLTIEHKPDLAIVWKQVVQNMIANGPFITNSAAVSPHLLH